LSKERANTVKKALEQYGVKPSNIMAIGYGPADPIASNDTQEGREMNRRVEFVIHQ
jgi:OOP family OmpA-OmpF porin